MIRPGLNIGAGAPGQPGHCQAPRPDRPPIGAGWGGQGKIDQCDRGGRGALDHTDGRDPTDAVSIGIVLANALNRERALTPRESELVAALVARSVNPRPLRRWTVAQDTQLRDLVNLGLTAAEIGVHIGRTTDAIHTRIKRLKEKAQGV